MKNIDYILGHIKTGECHNFLGLEGSSALYMIAKVWNSLKKPVVVICKDQKEVEKVSDAFEYLTMQMRPGQVITFPCSESLPYTHVIPQNDVWTDRLHALYVSQNENSPLIVTSVDSLLRKMTPRDKFIDAIEYLAIGQKLEKDEFLHKLVSAGYNSSPLVEDRGEFASRGFILDIWSGSTDHPVRIELDSDEIVSIRAFDPGTQRTSFSIDRVTIIPVRSVILDEEIIKNGLSKLKKICDANGISAVERREFADSVKRGIYPSYLETLLPVFHPDAGYLFEYLDDNSVIFSLDHVDVRESYSKFRIDLEEAYKNAEHIERAVKPKDLFISLDDFIKNLKTTFITINELATISDKKDSEIINTQKPLHASGKWIEGSSEGALTEFVRKLNEWIADDYQIFILCHTEMQADRVLDLIRWQGLTALTENVSIISNDKPKSKSQRINILISVISEGFIWPDEKIVVITEKELFGKKIRRVPKGYTVPTEAFASYQELCEGDFLVHIKHGVGRYLGMQQMQFGEMKNDFLKIEYLGNDKLYIPAYQLSQIQKYIGPGDGSPFLDKLGGNRWEKAKIQANRSVRKIAAELLRIYAERKIKNGFAFSGRDHLMEEFEAAFPYDETPDQARAIDDVLQDMSDFHPADRLICGDVGYGKTEVAIRAAFRAVADSKQVAILVPTTILAFQHYETFKERFKSNAVSIDFMNRFRTKTEQKAICKKLEAGLVDIVVGTHRIIQSDIKFKDLGLLIIDEEHRFGVRQKEQIKKLRTSVDVISMSATPIPRTLHISLVGARDISVINTPPVDRRAIRTYVADFDEGLIRGAILKELRRGGQVFFVHNRVETIESMKDRLKKIVPEARIAVGHGQMHEHQLEKIMIGYLKKEYDVLLCTTIIESGLDIRNANTIIINRADTFGLAQLYQIRGRVGRSSEQAYAYLLIPDKNSISAIASKRLAALQKYTELGAGFQIAMHDLEIRGSGNILGAEQSGHISAVGYELYTELLEKEINKLKGIIKDEEIETELQIPVEAYLPKTFIEDDGTRIVFYKRISSIKDEKEIDDMSAELNDRFGPLPDEVLNLLKIIETRINAMAVGIEVLQVGNGNFIYKFAENTKVPASKILSFVKKNSKHVKLKPPSTLIIQEDVASNKEVFRYIRKHLDIFKTMIEQ